MSGWTVLVWATVSRELSGDWLVQDGLLFTCLPIQLLVGTMRITGPHVSPRLVHMEVVPGVPRAVREGKLWFTSTFKDSYSVTFAVVSVAQASDMVQLQVMDTERKFGPFCKQSPLESEKKVAKNRNVIVLGNKRNCRAREIKNSKYSWMKVLKVFTKDLFFTLSQLCLHLWWFPSQVLSSRVQRILTHPSSFHSPS